MRKYFCRYSCVLVLCFLFSSLNFAGAENAYKVGSPFNIKMGDSEWEVKVISATEKPYTKDQKMVDVLVSYRNASPAQKVQPLDPNNWSFYIIGNDAGSYKAEALNYKRDPGDVHWWNAQDALPGTLFMAKIPVAVSKAVAARQFVIMADVATPSQVAVELPVTAPSAALAIPPAETISSAPAASGQTPQAPSSSTGLESEAQAGYGLMAGYLLGVSGVYWSNTPLGGQVILSRTGSSSSLGVSARLLLKYFATPFGRLFLAPQVGYQFNLEGGAVSKDTYGIIAGAEFIMPFPVTVAGGKNVIKTQDTWLSFLAFEKAKAIGLSGEIGYYGNDLRNINLDPTKLTPGFTMAGHIYL